MAYCLRHGRRCPLILQCEPPSPAHTAKNYGSGVNKDPKRHRGCGRGFCLWRVLVHDIFKAVEESRRNSDGCKWQTKRQQQPNAVRDLLYRHDPCRRHAATCVSYIRHRYPCGGFVAGLGIGAFFVTPWLAMNFSMRKPALTMIDRVDVIVGCSIIGVILSAF